MGGFSDYWEEKIFNHVFGKSIYTPPTIYIGLSTEDPTDDGSALAEPNGNAYTRVQTSASDWNIASGGSLDNASEIAFPMATGSWGTITYFGLFDNATGGNMLLSGPLSTPRAIGVGEITKFMAGDLVLNLD